MLSFLYQTGLMNTTKAVYKLMDKSTGGQGGIILNMSSIAGMTFFPGYETYCATKHGVLAFTKTLSGLYEKTGVAMLVICPGCTETPILKNVTDISLFKVQPVEVVGEYLVKCIEAGKNGAIYMINDSIGEEIEQTPYQLKL